MELVKKKLRGFSFEESKWEEIIDNICLLFKFDASIRSSISTHKVIKLIASIPFIANCKNPDRISLSHLTTYFLAASKEGKLQFSHKLGDNLDILNRLERISHFDEGEQSIIDQGMNLLSLVMIEDYYRDKCCDQINEKYNPFICSDWNYLEVKNKLTTKINNSKCRYFDSILNINDTYNTYWGY